MCNERKGLKMKEIKFVLFADLHYKKEMYMSMVSDLAYILKRGKDNGVDFAIHCGDMCNDYIRSPELINTYLKNPYDMPAYGLYGNHELESEGNSMARVTPLLNNREVVWGTADGKIGDGSVGYYYFDLNGYRIICVDTNYSWNPQKECYEHNLTCSYGEPRGNVKVNSLGPVQLLWLEQTLNDAAEQKLQCLIFAHESFSGVWSSSPDTAAVQEMIRRVNAKQPRTVRMVINGHLHSNHENVLDNVVHWDTNTVRNGLWMPIREPHYTNETFLYTDYDEQGNETRAWERPLTDLWMHCQTWFYADPLCAIVTLREDGYIKVDGAQSSWYADVVPTTDKYPLDPSITSKEYYL